MWNDAAMNYLSAGEDSIVPDLPRRSSLLNMLVAHLAILEQRSLAGGATGGMVGNIASASEGGVSVSMAAYPVGSGKWFEQTQPGASYWTAIQQFKSAVFIRGPRPYTGVPYPFTYRGR
jgi:hypothetical protein